MNDYVFINAAGQFLLPAGEEIHFTEHTIEKPEVIWASGACVSMLTVSVPSRSQNVLEQSIPYAVEESLLCDIYDMHFAWVLTPKSEPLPVAVVDKKIMTIWQTSLKQAGLRSVELLPDIFLVPWQAGQCTLLILADRAIVRTGEFEGISGDHKLVLDYLRNQEMNRDSLQAICLSDGVPSREWEQYNPVTGEEACALLSAYRTPRAINLFQGEYSGGLGLLRMFHHWYMPALAAGLVLFILALDNLAAYIQLRQEQQQIHELIVTQAQQIYSDYEPGNPLRLLINRKVEALQAALEAKNNSSWTILEKATLLLSQCSNCVYENITLQEGGFTFRVGSYSSLAPLEHTVKQEIDSYKVTTSLTKEQRNGEPYNYLNVSIQRQEQQ